MRQWHLRLSFLTALAALVTGVALTDTTKNDQVLQAETDWFQAMRSGSADSISSLLADGFVGISDIGRKFERQEWIAQYSHEWSRPLRDFSVRNQQIRFHDDVAVVTGEVQYARPRGLYTTAYSHVWRNINSAWRMVSLQESPVIPPAMK